MRFITQLVRRLVGLPHVLGALDSLQRKVDTLQPTAPMAPAVPTLRGETFAVRRVVSETFLKGQGIEIGAFAAPLPPPAGAQVRYVDKYDINQLDATHKIAGLTLEDFGVRIESIVKPDIVDDGECLSKVGDLSQDFVIANHVMEHFEDPIKGFKNMLRVLKHGGILYLSLPEMRHSFDKSRHPTPFEHLLRDYHEGPAGTRQAAYQEFAKIFVAHGMDKGLFPRHSGTALQHFEEQTAKELNDNDFSIHFHAWTMDGMQEMFLKMKSTFHLSFETRLVVKNNDEVIFIFEKSVPDIHPSSSPE